MIQAVGNVQTVNHSYNAPSQKPANRFWKKYCINSAIATGIGGAIGAGVGAILSIPCRKEITRKKVLWYMLGCGVQGAGVVAFGSAIAAAIVGIVQLCKEVPKNE